MIPEKRVEPFNLIGQASIISSKEQAAKILKDNSYYIFVVAIAFIFISIYMKFVKIDIGIHYSWIFFFGFIDLGVGLAIYKLKSRVASLISFCSFSYVIFLRIASNDIGGLFFCSIILVMAAYRCVQASIFYHRILD